MRIYKRRGAFLFSVGSSSSCEFLLIALMWRMVVICVTLRQFFLSEFFAELAVNLDERIAKSFLILLSKDIAQVMHQACCCKEYGWVFEGIHAFQQILCIDISLCCSCRQPMQRCFLILPDIMPQKIQFAEGILRILVSLFCRFGEQFHSLYGIFL